MMTCDLPRRRYIWEAPVFGVMVAVHPLHDFARPKIAGFDLYGTLIKTRSGAQNSLNLKDWVLCDSFVENVMLDAHIEGFQIVIFADMKSMCKETGKVAQKDFQNNVEDIIEALGVPAAMFISLFPGYYQRPFPGLWEVFNKKIPIANLNRGERLYVGDEYERSVVEALDNPTPADFKNSDLLFSMNIGVKFFTPEEFFLSKRCPIPEIRFHPFSLADGAFDHPDYDFPDDKEVIMMVGPRFAGKSFFVEHFIAPQNYVVLDKQCANSEKCFKLMKDLIEQNKKIVIDDNNNHDSASRKKYIDFCKENNVNIRCFFMLPLLERCIHHSRLNLMYESEPIPDDETIKQIHANLKKPTIEDGFSAIVEVPFVPRFSCDEQEQIYHQYLIPTNIS